MSTQPIVTGTDGSSTAEAALMRAAQLAAALDAPMHIVTGYHPPNALVTIAEHEDAQMIVVGNRGMSGARRMLEP